MVKSFVQWLGTYEWFHGTFYSVKTLVLQHHEHTVIFSHHLHPHPFIIIIIIIITEGKNGHLIIERHGCISNLVVQCDAAMGPV